MAADGVAKQALRCLKQLYQPRPISSYEDQIPVLCNTTAIMLSKAATTEELVAFLTEKPSMSNQSLSKLNIKRNSMVNRLETEIQAYLKRTNGR